MSRKGSVELHQARWNERQSGDNFEIFYAFNRYYVDHESMMNAFLWEKLRLLYLYARVLELDLQGGIL